MPSFKNITNISLLIGSVIFQVLHRADIALGVAVLSANDNAPLGICCANTFQAMDDMVLLARIREQHHLSLGSYGRPRLTQELKEVGLHVGHRRDGRLMLQNGIRIVRTNKYKATTDSNHRFNIAPNWLDCNFTAERSNQKWAGDISYNWTREGWLYPAVMIDLHSRHVIGWAVSNRLKAVCRQRQGHYFCSCVPHLLARQIKCLVPAFDGSDLV